MKKILFFVLVIILVSCGQSNKESSWEEELEQENFEKEKLKKEYLDSIVNLSFCGISLGHPYISTVYAAKKQGLIKDVKLGNDSSAVCKANIYLPDQEEPITVDLKICSFQDTITSFIISYDNYEGQNSLLTLYQDKYNFSAAQQKDSVEDWGDQMRRHGYKSLIWSFKNQSISFTTFYEEERENYVKDPTKRSYENRYGVKYTEYFEAIAIIYSDVYQCAKAEAYNKVELEKINKEQKIKEAERKVKEDEQMKILKERAINQNI